MKSFKEYIIESHYEYYNVDNISEDIFYNIIKNIKESYNHIKEKEELIIKTKIKSYSRKYIDNIKNKKNAFLINIKFIKNNNMKNIIKISSETPNNFYKSKRYITIKIYINYNFDQYQILNYIKNNKKLIINSIKSMIWHENTHRFDIEFNRMKGTMEKAIDKIKKIYKDKNISKEEKEKITQKTINKYEKIYNNKIKLNRTSYETNAYINELINTYKELEANKNINIYNISLLELIKYSNSIGLIMILATSKKLQKYYITRLNREGIPIRRTGFPKNINKDNLNYFFKVQKNRMNKYLYKNTNKPINQEKYKEKIYHV